MGIKFTPFQKNNKWAISMPSRVTKKGKREYLYYDSKTQADKAAQSFRKKYNHSGIVGFSNSTQISPFDAVELTNCKELLSKHNLSLTEVCREMSEMVEKCGSMTNVRNYFDATYSLKEKEKNSISFEELMSKFMSHRNDLSQENKIVSRTFTDDKRYYNRAKIDYKKIFSQTIRTIEKVDFENLLDAAWGKKPSFDKNHAKSFLSRLCEYAIENGWLDINVVKNIKDYLPNVESKLALTLDEVKSLLHACREATDAERKEKEKANGKDNRYKFLDADLSDCLSAVCLMTFLGIRPKEMERLTWDMIDFNSKVLAFPYQTQKVRARKGFPPECHLEISDNLLLFLKMGKARFQKNPKDKIIPSNWIRKWSALRHRAGWNENKPWKEDSLRHTFASYYAKKYPDQETKLCSIMRHRGKMLLWNTYINMRGITDYMVYEFFDIHPTVKHCTPIEFHERILKFREITKNNSFTFIRYLEGTFDNEFERFEDILEKYSLTIEELVEINKICGKYFPSFEIEYYPEEPDPEDLITVNSNELIFKIFHP